MDPATVATITQISLLTAYSLDHDSMKKRMYAHNSPYKKIMHYRYFTDHEKGSSFLMRASFTSGSIGNFSTFWMDNKGWNSTPAIIFCCFVSLAALFVILKRAGYIKDDDEEEKG